MFDFHIRLWLLSNNVPRISNSSNSMLQSLNINSWTHHLFLSLKCARQARECRLRVLGCLTESPVTFCWCCFSRSPLGCWASSKREMSLAREVTKIPVNLGWLAETCWTELYTKSTIIVDNNSLNLNQINPITYGLLKKWKCLDILNLTFYLGILFSFIN